MLKTQFAEGIAIVQFDSAEAAAGAIARYRGVSSSGGHWMSGVHQAVFGVWNLSVDQGTDIGGLKIAVHVHFQPREIVEHTNNPYGMIVDIRLQKEEGRLTRNALIKFDNAVVAERELQKYHFDNLTCRTKFVGQRIGIRYATEGEIAAGLGKPLLPPQGRVVSTGPGQQIAVSSDMGRSDWV